MSSNENILGIQIEENLLWNSHFQYISNEPPSLNKDVHFTSLHFTHCYGFAFFTFSIENFSYSLCLIPVFSVSDGGNATLLGPVQLVPMTQLEILQRALRVSL